MVQKLHIWEKVYFDSASIFSILLLLFLHILLLSFILLFGCWNFSIPSGCQTVWILIRPDIMWGLMFAKVISRQQKSLLAGKKLNTKQLVDTTFWLKPWLKLISFASNFFHLARVFSQGKPCFSVCFKSFFDKPVKLFSVDRCVLFGLKIFLFSYFVFAIEKCLDAQACLSLRWAPKSWALTWQNLFSRFSTKWDSNQVLSYKD